MKLFVTTTVSVCPPDCATLPVCQWPSPSATRKDYRWPRPRWCSISQAQISCIDILLFFKWLMYLSMIWLFMSLPFLYRVEVILLLCIKLRFTVLYTAFIRWNSYILVIYKAIFYKMCVLQRLHWVMIKHRVGLRSTLGYISKQVTSEHCISFYSSGYATTL